MPVKFPLHFAVMAGWAALSVAASAASLPITQNFDGVSLGDNTPPGFTETISSNWSIIAGAAPGDREYQNSVIGATGGVASSSLIDAGGTLGGSNKVSFTLSSTFVLTDASTALTSTLGFAALSDNLNATGAATYYLADISQAGTIRLVQLVGGAILSTNGYVAAPVVNLSGGLQLDREYTFTLSGTYTTGNAIDLNFSVVDSTDPLLTASASATATTALTGTNFGYRNRQQATAATDTMTSAQDNFSLTVVPEPSAAVLLGFCASGLALFRRKRR